MSIKAGDLCWTLNEEPPSFLADGDHYVDIGLLIEVHAYRVVGQQAARPP